MKLKSSKSDETSYFKTFQENMTEAINLGEQNGGVTYDDQDSNVYEKVEIKSDLTHCEDKAIETV